MYTYQSDRTCKEDTHFDTKDRTVSAVYTHVGYVWFVGDSDEGVKQSHNGGRGHHLSIHQIGQKAYLHTHTKKAVLPSPPYCTVYLISYMCVVIYLTSCLAFSSSCNVRAFLRSSIKTSRNCDQQHMHIHRCIRSPLEAW